MIEHTYSLRIDEVVWRELVKIAAQKGEPAAGIIRRLVRLYVETTLDKSRYCVTGEGCAVGVLQGFGLKPRI